MKIMEDKNLKSIALITLIIGAMGIGFAGFSVWQIQTGYVKYDNGDNGEDGCKVGMETNVFLKISSDKKFNKIYNDILVNNYTTNDQYDPSICALSENIFAVAWTNSSYINSDDGDVYAKVFNSTTGNNMTAEFRVNNYTANNQRNPSICALSNETFAIAWQSDMQDSSDYGIYARVFNTTTGNNITAEFRVNYITADSQWDPAICALSANALAVAWTSNQQDGDGSGIYARVFNATTGNNLTAEFRVNYITVEDQWEPAICALSADTFAVVWRSYQQDGDGSGIYGRVFNATTGNNITPEFRVNYETSYNQNAPTICPISADTFAVAWMSDQQDGMENGVYARVFNATTGNEVTPEFRVNYETYGNQVYPSICALSTDTFAVAYQGGGLDYDIYTRVFNAITGIDITDEFRVNYNTLGDQIRPTICALSADVFAVAYIGGSEGLDILAAVFVSEKIPVENGGDGGGGGGGGGGKKGAAIPGFDLVIISNISIAVIIAVSIKLGKKKNFSKR